MEAIHNLLRRRVHEHNGKLDDLVQVGPRVLFARALEVEHTDDSRGGSNWWWWGWRRPRPLALLASLASSGLDSRQSGAFRGKCYRRRGEEGEAHFFSCGFTVLATRAFQLHECGALVILPLPRSAWTVPEAAWQAVAVLALGNL